MKSILEIELLSDMCCGTGEGNGSTLDTVAAFDKDGLPVIPGKTLKGLLKDRCRVFVDNGFVTSGELTALFGGLKGQDGLLRFDKGVIKNYSAVKKDIADFDSAAAGIVTKGAIRRTFTTVRKQTAHDSAGIAKKMSLRATETVKRGLKFYAAVSADRSLTESEELILTACVKTLRHIGMNKTRGFGEVACKLDVIKEEEKEEKNEIGYTFEKQGEIVTVHYTVNLLDDVVISAGSNNGQDYISGGMVIGALARFTKDYNWFKDVVLENTKFSNAYLSVNGRAFVPAPMSLCAVKNDSKEVFNLADGYEKDDNNQYVPYNGYIHIYGGKVCKMKVADSVSFHSTAGTDGAPKNLYSYKTIEEGQLFSGTITADKGAVELLKQLLESRGNILYFGGSATAEYAKCEFIVGDAVAQKKVSVQDKGKVIVELLSDAIVVDEFGNNSGNISVLLEDIYGTLGIKPACAFPYTKTAVVGGFNAKWSLPKRQYTAFLKGSVLELNGCAETEIEEYGYLGLFNNEGYGRYRIRVAGQQIFKMEKPEKLAAAEESADEKVAAEKDKKVFQAETLNTINEVLLDHIVSIAKTQAMKAANTVNTINLSPSSAMRFLAAFKSVSGELDLKTKLDNYVEVNFKNRNDLYNLSKNAIKAFAPGAYAEKCGLAGAKDVADTNADRIFTEYISAFIGQLKRNYQKGEKQ